MEDTKSENKTKTRPIISNRTLRFYEHHRIITIVYEYNRETKILKYGAAIFKEEPDTPKNFFVKKDHRKTAISRLHKKPVTILNFQDNKTISDFNSRVRKLLIIHGVSIKTKPQK